MAEKNPEVVSSHASSVIESKLSKTEAIEIMVDDLTKELKRALANAEVELKKVSSLRTEDLMGHLPDAMSVTFNAGGRYNEGIDKFSFNLGYVAIPAGTILRDPSLKERAQRIKDLTIEVANLQEQLHRLTSDKVSTKVAILKSILEQTTEGQEWLKQLENIRRVAAKRFGFQVNVRTLAGKI